MAHRSPARWLAPIALVAFLFALIAVVGSSGGSDAGTGNEAAAPNATATGAAGEDDAEDEGDADSDGAGEKKFYVVKLGDTPSQIADENGLTLEELEELNPDLDPQLMQTGDRIRLRK